MSTTIETSNRGNVPDFGFFGPDTRNIGMGEMPDMPLPEFCFNATEAVVKALPYCTPSQTEGIKRVVTQCENFLKSQNDDVMPILDNVVDREKLVYPANPFWVDTEKRTISIGETYEGIQIDKFAHFALRTFGGGLFGWGEGGVIPPSAIQGFRVIRDAVNRLERD